MDKKAPKPDEHILSMILKFYFLWSIYGVSDAQGLNQESFKTMSDTSH